MDTPTLPGLPKVENITRHEDCDFIYHQSTLLSAQIAMMNAIDRMDVKSPLRKVAERKFLNMAAAQTFIKGLHKRLREFEKNHFNWQFAFMKLRKENLEMKNEIRQLKATIKAYESEG